MRDGENLWCDDRATGARPLLHRELLPCSHAFDAIAPDAEISRGLGVQLNRALADAWQQRR